MESLSENRPDVARYKLSLGKYLNSLGQTFNAQRKFPRAEAAFERSRTVLEELAADHPGDMNIAAALVDLHFLISEFLLVRGNGQSAWESADRAVQLNREMGRRDPRNLDRARLVLWIAIAQRGEVSMRLGRFGESLADFEEVLRLTHGTRNEELFRAFHALAKARQGDLSELALLGSQIRRTMANAGQAGMRTYTYWMTCYDGACIHAALAKLVLQEQGKPAGERHRLAQQDLTRALNLLDQMREIGELRDLIHLDEIRGERLLDPLRSHPRFQLLMMDLAFPEEPFRP
jgi:tetratricopeptide (TPR) repeat protein